MTKRIEVNVVDDKPPRAAVLQFEVDRVRLVGMRKRRINLPETFASNDTIAIAHAALDDVFKNNGTFVCVVSDNKITIVQREGAEDL